MMSSGKAPASAVHRLCVMHPMDPRGSKLGGIETHVRLILRRHPADFSVIFVGVDEFGDCRLGEVVQLDIEGRKIDFLPVVRIPQSAINLPGKRISESTTFRFAKGVLRYFSKVRAQVKGRPASVDVQRFEFAVLAKLLGIPHVQMVHGEGSKDQKMDSLIKSYWAIHRTNEWLALHLANHILCVNPNIVARLRREFPNVVNKAEVMTVSVDTKQFSPQPFDCRDGIFRIVFAGRLDEFKDPPLMFRTLAGLHGRLGGQLEFHYVGTTDPHRYLEFASIESFTMRHGYQPPPSVANIMARCHAGILTSYFEGMPCYLLETLAVGRPFAAIRLPQYDPLIVPGMSGVMVERTEPDTICEEQLVDSLAGLWKEICQGRFDPNRVHEKIQPYSVENQMARLFACHRALQAQYFPAAVPSALQGSAIQE